MRGSTNAQPTVPISNSTRRFSKTLSAGNGITTDQIWACTEAGNYIVELNAQSSGSSPTGYYLIGVATSSQERWLQESTNATGYVRISGSCTLTLAQGESVAVQFYCTTAGWPQLSYVAHIIRLN